MIRTTPTLTHRTLFVATVLATALITTPAAADELETSDEGWEIGFGARIGGYGFREVEADSVTWQDCRMDGTGVFVTVDFTDRFFGEAGLDLYHATGPTVAAGMDRISFHNQYAAGVRIFPKFFVTPYIQVGGGPEITHIEVGGAEETKVVPSGFMGIGGELNIGDLKLGMNVRALMMNHPVHEHSATGEVQLALDGAHGEVATDEVRTDWEVAGQGQFFARFAF